VTHHDGIHLAGLDKQSSVAAAMSNLIQQFALTQSQSQLGKPSV